MISSVDINKLQLVENSQNSWPKHKYDLKHTEENVELMRNRVEILRKQLQKQKQSIQRHKSLIQQTVQQKMELNRISSIKRRNQQAFDEEAEYLRARNHSYRQLHKNEMNNILKALYMVKMDDAQQIKKVSLQNELSLQHRNQAHYNEQKLRKKQVIDQSQRGRQRYLNYWKNKLNGIYNQLQSKLQQNEEIVNLRRQQMEQLQVEQLTLLEQINNTRNKDMEAKKEYIAALTLKNKQVSQAVMDQRLSNSLVLPTNLKLQKRINPIDNKQYHRNQEEFYAKSPIVSFMSSSNVEVPRASVDQKKLQSILRELRKQKQPQSY